MDGLVRPGDADYAALCAAWNVAVEHQPAYVVAAESAEQVRDAVAFAAANGLRVRVQGTGHGAISPATGDELLISTARLNDVLIDPETSSALVGAGAKWRAVIDAAFPHGLAPLVGSASDVGVAGYSLGGGMGFLCRKYGLASDAIMEAHVVTGDGELVWADEELLWALRGGGPNFGVVTALRTRLVPAAQIYAGALYWPVQSTREVLYGYRDWVASAPIELVSAAGVLHVPDLPMIPEPMRGQSFARVCVCHCGPDFSGVDALLAPLRAIPGLMADMTGVIPFTRVDEITQDPEQPLPFTIRGEMLTELTDGVLDHLVEVAPRETSPYILTLLRHCAGMPARPGLAYADAAFALEAVCAPPTPDALAFCDRLSAAVAHAATGGVPFNFVASPEQVKLAYTSEYAERLLQLRKRYDPAGLFGGDRMLTS
ncbi:FAD-binding oxidoreductase [Nonomuraea sp. NPDC050556]|uniref:FAD-binding oxidoreductase n=1 Tax=Nonomuraea sp. NPDC050556 TaxID=3364369 RepID=UPI0037AC8432